MTLRIALLRAMLWSLALSAALGVLAVLFQSGSLVWRIVGTGFTTGLACALMLPTSDLIDRERSRSAGLLGMAGIIVEFVGALALIWDVPAAWGEEIGLTMLFLGMAVVLIMCFLKLLQEPYGAVAGRVGVVVTVVVFVTLMIATWKPFRATRMPFRRVDDDMWALTGVAIATMGMLAVLGLMGVGTGDRRHWRWAGVVASIIACTMWLADIWVGVGSDPGFVVFCALISVAAVVAHANLSFFCPLTREQRWVRVGAIAAAVFTAGMIDLITAAEKFPTAIGVDQDLLVRLASAGGIVAGCGTLALCVLYRMNRKVDFEPSSLELSEMTVVCPRCRKKQAIRIGDSTCEACELRISIRIEEPRCPQCDYLLYRLTSDRCPECGTVIATGRVESRIVSLHSDERTRRPLSTRFSREVASAARSSPRKGIALDV